MHGYGQHSDPHFSWGVSPDDWSHWSRSPARQTSSTVHSISHTQLNIRLKQYQLPSSPSLRLPHDSKHYKISIPHSAVVCRTTLLCSDSGCEYNGATQVWNYSLVFHKVLQDVGIMMLLKCQWHSVTFYTIYHYNHKAITYCSCGNEYNNKSKQNECTLHDCSSVTSGQDPITVLHFQNVPRT